MRSTMNDRFLKACRREPVDCTPVWFMRQAGRYMIEYRQLREKHSILELCKTPELAAQVTLQPIDRFALDAAIIFADILLPLEPMGLSLEFAEGEGPIIHNPVRDRASVERLKVIDDTELQYVMDAISLTRTRLAGRVPLIGFAGSAPQNIRDPSLDLMDRPEQGDRIKVSLHRTIVAHEGPGFVERDPPIDSDHISACLPHRLQNCRGACAEVNKRHAFVLQSLENELDMRHDVFDIVTCG